MKRKVEYGWAVIEKGTNKISLSYFLSYGRIKKIYETEKEAKEYLISTEKIEKVRIIRGGLK